MSRHRFFATGPLTDDGVVPLSPADAHHLAHVLRVQPGEEIVVVWGGVASRVRLRTVTPDVRGDVVGGMHAPEVPPVTLVQALAKGEKMDTIVRQATELGVQRIVPLAAARSVVRLDAGKVGARLERWGRIAAEAAKQAQRADVPEVSAPVGIAEVAALGASGLVLVCQEESGEHPGIAEAIGAARLDAGEGVTVVVGPEGGLAPDEVAALTAGGARLVTLGPTILRTETAGVVSVALALAARGGLGHRHA